MIVVVHDIMDEPSFCSNFEACEKNVSTGLGISSALKLTQEILNLPQYSFGWYVRTRQAHDGLPDLVIGILQEPREPFQILASIKVKVLVSNRERVTRFIKELLHLSE